METQTKHPLLEKKLSPMSAVGLLVPTFYEEKEDPECFNFKAIIAEKLKIEIRDILKRISKLLEMPEEKILEKTRKPEQVYARQLCMFMSRLYTKYKLAIIGKQLGGKDHATVVHATTTILDWYDTNNKKRDQIDLIIAFFNLKTKTRMSVDMLRN